MSKRIYQDQVFTAFILLSFTLLLALSGALNRFDHVFYDTSQYFSFKKPPQDIVIIAIDERSLDALGKWPWRRSIHAELLQILKNVQAKAIGLDIFFSEPDKKFPEDDLVLAQAFSETSNIVLPVVIDAPYQGARLVESRTMASLPKVREGRVNVPLDSDGIARGIDLWEAVSYNDQPTLGLPHFSTAVLAAANLLPKNFQEAPQLTPEKKSVFASQVLRRDARRIHFIGPPGHFQQVSYSDVLSGEVDASFFTNKIVLVGATAVGMGDVLATPVSGFSRPMPGVEFHANALETIRNGQLVHNAPLWLTCLICAILALIPLLWLPKFQPFQSLMTIVAYFVLVVLVTMLLPVVANLWLPTASALLMILLAYPIWSWRRLERAHAFLNLELKHLSEDLKQFGGTVAEKKFVRPDLLDDRIAQVKRASHLLRSLQKKRNDTLSFISHDLRTPLATALMLLRGEDAVAQKNKIIDTLARANQLAESFLQLSKAEAILPTQFKTLELNGLLQEVTDNLYEIARAKKIQIELQVEEAPLWVNGDFALLQRTFENLIQNAVQYSVEGARVEVGIRQRETWAEVQVTNHGVGIAQEKIPHLFQKFTRLEEGMQMARGSGLGLYFVWLTLEKHHGNVKVESVENERTTFTVTLPLQS